MSKLTLHSMRKITTSLSAAVAAASALVGRAYAAGLSSLPNIPELASGTNLKEVIVKLLSAVLDFVLLVAVIFVVVAGIRLIVSSGEETEKDKAKKTIIYVVAGIIVILLARVLVVFVNNLLGPPSP